MPRTDERWSGWRGVCLVAITYVYFLIFAQFAFLNRLSSLGIARDHLKAIMAAMAVGGIGASLIAAHTRSFPNPRMRLQAALAACAIAASSTLLPLSFAAITAVSWLIGSALGLLTVTLVTHLRLWAGNRHSLFTVGLGTGLGYFICNLPILFTATPQIQAATAAVLCVAGVAIAILATNDSVETRLTPSRPALPFVRVLACFGALVWLDSAAFFIVQNTPALKAGTWSGTVHLWLNASLHLLAALASVWLLRQRGLQVVFICAFAALATACLLLHQHLVLLASVFYPIGVSLYSVALVAYPSLLAFNGSTEDRARQAGWIYAFAGWVGSAMGIGMAQNLRDVPMSFVVVAGVLIAGPELLRLFRARRHELAMTAAVLLAAFCIERAIVASQSKTSALTSVATGRQVYIAEGCINCHSQYVRPNSPDVLLWGPAMSLDELRRERPPLIGNRREGPDLSQVGGRRSELWLEAHFYNPSEVSHNSFMPSYAYLFRDHRGTDLTAYMESLRGGDIPGHLRMEASWRPSLEASSRASVEDGKKLVHSYCDTCHAVDGATRLGWRSSFRTLPPDFDHIGQSNSGEQMENQLARITKFGLPGTDMPGHEYLSDYQIASIARYLSRFISGGEK